MHSCTGTMTASPACQISMAAWPGTIRTCLVRPCPRGEKPGKLPAPQRCQKRFKPVVPESRLQLSQLDLSIFPKRGQMHALSSYCRLEAAGGVCREGILTSLTAVESRSHKRYVGRVCSDAIMQRSGPIPVEQSQTKGSSLLGHFTTAELF